MLKRGWMRVLVFIFAVTVGLAVYSNSFHTYLSVEARADRNVNLRVFFDNGNEEGYRFDDQHMTDNYLMTPKKKKISIDLPKESMVRLRLDFGEEPCTVWLYKIQLAVSPARVIELAGEQVMDMFQDTQDISNVSIDDEISIRYEVIGSDGFIAATEDLLTKGITWNVEFVRVLVRICVVSLLVSCIDLFWKACALIHTRFGKKIKRLLFTPKNWKETIFSTVSCVISALLCAIIFDGVVLKLILELASMLNLDTLSRYFSEAEFFSWKRIIFFFNLLLIPSICVWLGKYRAVKYRYVLAFLLLVLMTIGQYTGSSLGYYDFMLQNNTEEYQCSTLLGIPQGIRGDEWATEKPYYFAQANGMEDFPYYNHKLMLDGADMVISAFAPIKDIITLFRPALLGFWFLPSANAFAFYWWWKIIALFMAAFEICRLISGRYYYGVMGAFVFVFAPPNQWWMSQAIIEIIAFGFYALVAYNAFLITEVRWKRILALGLTFYCVTGFVFTMYPASQVPFAYIFLAILIWIIWKNRDKKPFSLRKLALYAGTSMPFVAVGLRFAHMSGDALLTMLHTTYPGSVRPWEKLMPQYPLYQLVNPLTANIQHPNFLNSCEISQYYSFTIVLIPFMLWLIWRNRKQKIGFLPMILFAFSTFLLLIVWIPEIPLLNKITLLNMSYPVRIAMAYGMGYMLTIIALLPELEERLQGVPQKMAKVFCGIGGLVIFCFTINVKEIYDYIMSARLGPFLLVIIIEAFSYMAYALIRGGEKYCHRFVLGLLVLSIFSTACINPITQGIDSMFEKTTMREIREIDQESPGRWMVSGDPVISNLVTAQGVARVTGTYYYPDWTMMEIIDPSHKYEQYWNQYAHVDMRLTDGDNIVSSYDYERELEMEPVYRIVYINLDTAQKLGIKYIFTSIELPQNLLENGSVLQRYVDPVDSWKIYEVVQ